MTRFDVVITRRIKETRIVGVDGAPRPGETELMAESVDGVVCCWCGHGDHVIVLGGLG